MKTWRYTDPSNTVVFSAFEDGHTESHLVAADCIQAWLAEGNTPLPYEPDPAEAQAALKQAAQEALDKCDRTALRCFKANVAWPTEWKDYDAALRSIVNGKSKATALPATPKYPAGS